MTAMTPKELMRLVSLYAEACDDLGRDLGLPAAEKDARYLNADGIHNQIQAEVTRLHAECARAERRAIRFGDLMHQQVLAMRAAAAASQLEGLSQGMQWIFNTLAGPGHLPNLGEARELGGAQALFDKELAEHEAFRASHPAPTAFDLVAHLHRQIAFSARTFGPGDRTAGVIHHIRKELIEVEDDAAAGLPTLGEWVDVIILALDGAWRSGARPDQIVDAIEAKQAKNEGRTWPDWRTADPGKAIEHDRTAETAA